MPRRILAIAFLLGVGGGAAAVGAVAGDPSRALRTLARARLELAGADYVGTEGVFLQRTFSDCGPAALVTLLRQLGREASADTLAVLAGTTARGTRLGGLVAAAAAVGVRARAVRMTPPERVATELHRRLPLLAWVDRGHFVVVASQRADGDFVILDPQVGAYAVSHGVLAARWSGEALVLE